MIKWLLSLFMIKRHIKDRPRKSNYKSSMYCKPNSNANDTVIRDAIIINTLIDIDNT